MWIQRAGSGVLKTFALLVWSGLLAAGMLSVASAAGDRFKDMSEIIKSLGPVGHLPENFEKRASIDLFVQFAFESADLPPDAVGQLDALAAALQSKRLERGLENAWATGISRQIKIDW